MKIPLKKMAIEPRVPRGNFTVLTTIFFEETGRQK